MRNEVTVRVPATTANIGPGFDCLGAALSLYNHFKFTVAPQTTFQVTGGVLSLNKADNLLYQSFRRLYQQIGQSSARSKHRNRDRCTFSKGFRKFCDSNSRGSLCG